MRLRKKTQSEFSSQRIELERRQRFNPLRHVSPEYIRRVHEEFNAGRIREAARLWDAIERTDDMIKTVAPKRKKAVSRYGWEIVADDDSPEAKRHAEILKFFYDQIIVTRADDKNTAGGISTLIRQMMDAAGKKYAVHEIVWKTINGGLTAELIQAPLWYFENTTGRLRYLSGVNEFDGTDLNPAEWLIHTGDGIMEACAVAYMFKHLPLQDWLIHSEKFGFPVAVGKSPDVPGSDGWAAMEDAVAAIGSADGAVISNSGDITFPSLGNPGNLPYKELIERMDRSMASLWRGADLSTISNASGTGASLQADESDLLEEDDAQSITDTLNEQLDRFVILFAAGAETPKAWVKIKTKVKDESKADIEVDRMLNELGWQNPAEELERRYGRTGLIYNPRTPAYPFANERSEPPIVNRQSSIDNAALLRNARNALAAAQQNDWQPVVERLAQIVDETPDEELIAALETFREKELPELAKKIFENTEAAAVLENTMAAALFNGWEEANAQ